MKIIVILLTTAILQVSASTYGQNVTLKQRNVKLETVLNEISKQTGYDFFYNEQLMNRAKPINLDLNNVNIESALEICFKDQPLAYTIENKIVTVKLKEKPSFLEKILDRFNNIDVSGKILDENGKPLPGASVKVKATGKAVSTDKDGRFFLRGVEEGAVLVLSFVGYLPKEVSAKRDMGNVVLEQSDNVLDQVQVIAYGTTTRRLSTGNIGTVKAEDIEKQPVNNPILALQGRVPGIQISQVSGFAGSGVKVLIQGQNSIYNGNDPFYVIDGVPYVSQLLPNLGAVLGTSKSAGLSEANYGNPLSFINPADIESIEVLKDADATAIYGSRAANGAILITTKKGKSGQTKVNLNLQSGFGKVASKLRMLNTQEYLEMRKEGKRNDNANILAADYDINGVWDTTRNTNWQKELIGGTARYNDIQANLSGGNELIQFVFGANYHHETPVILGNFQDQKVSLHFNINNTSQNSKFRFTFSGSYLVDNNQLPNTDLTSMAIYMPPTAPMLYNQDGSLNWALNSNGSTTWPNGQNPISYTYNKYKNRTNNLIGNAILGYDLLPGLTIKSNFGYNRLFSKETVTFPITSSRPEWRELYGSRLRSAQFGENQIETWIIEPQLTYAKQTAFGRIESLIGGSIQQSGSNGLNYSGSDFNSDDVLEDIRSAANKNFDGTLDSHYKYAALFARFNYNWQDKYLLSLTARRDGSSRFGVENKYHNFGAFGAAWIFTNERFFYSRSKFLSYGKLRLSYGTTGSDQINNYTYISLYDSVDVPVPYQGAVGLMPRNLSNPYLQWEETRKLNIGLDLGFFKDRLLFTSSYFENRSSNQLLGFGLSSFTGFHFVSANLPATVKNSGLELSISGKIIYGRKFGWNTNINLTTPNNKLIEFKDLENSSYANSYIIGQPISFIPVYRYAGVDKTTGTYKVYDQNGNPTATPNRALDAKTYVNTLPKFYGGLQNSFSYQNFQLDFLFQFVKQVGRNYFFGSNGPGSAFINQPYWVMDRWRSVGNNALVQKFSSENPTAVRQGRSAATGSELAYSDASYIRLKNVSFSWQLTENWLKDIKMQSLRIFMNAQNLITITNYRGLDPETMSSTTLPPLKVITLGIQSTF